MRHDPLSHAIQHCSFKERIQIKTYLTVQKITTEGNNNAGIDSATNHQANEFWAGMVDFPTTLPELYIYSAEDSLTPPDSLRELIEEQKRNLDRV